MRRSREPTDRFHSAPRLFQVDRTYVCYRGRKLSYFSGSDYYRLASHPEVVAALCRGLEHYELNVAASRITTGNHPIYEKLERRLATAFGAEQAVLVSCGYAANQVAAQGLAGQFSHVLLDDRAHASLIDAAQFFQCPVWRFRHRDPSDLRAKLSEAGSAVKPILLTDGLFAHDGSVAPVNAYLDCLPPKGRVFMDDAHGAGVLGAQGRGTVEWATVSRRRVIQTITLSKAFGVYGGAILCGNADCRRIRRRSRWYIGNTPPPLPWVAAALTALDLVCHGPELRQRLADNAEYVKQELRRAGIPVADWPAPIISFVPRRASGVRRWRRQLLAAGIYPPFIRYPGGPAMGYFRFVISSEHSAAQLKSLIDTLTSLNLEAGNLH